MVAKKRKAGAARARGRSKEQRAWWQSRNLAIGVIVFLLIGGVGLLFFSALRGGDSSKTATTDLDKSKGPADAPVVVIEYGDFQ